MEFDEVLATCIERLELGESIESCLALFPDEAAELEPLLRMAYEVRSMEAPKLSDAGFKRGRQAVAEAALTNKEYSLVSGPPDSTVMLLDESAPRADTRHQVKPKRQRKFAWPTFVGTAVAAAALIAVLFGLSLSPQIAPGNALYTAKQVTEQGQGLIMAALGNDAEWRVTVANRRLAELLTLQTSGQPVSIEQMNRALVAIDYALAASEDMSGDEQARIPR